MSVLSCATGPTANSRAHRCSDLRHLAAGQADLRGGNDFARDHQFGVAAAAASRQSPRRCSIRMTRHRCIPTLVPPKEVRP